MKNNLLTIGNLPLTKKFVYLPYRNEKVQFTGVYSKPHNSIFDIGSVYAETVIFLPNGEVINGVITFYYDDELKTYTKKLDCNFYEAE